MPPRRSTPRRAAAAAAASSRQQATLSFHGKSNKITKQTSPRNTGKTIKSDPSLLTEDQVVVSEVSLKPKSSSPSSPPEEPPPSAQPLPKSEPDPLSRSSSPVTTASVLGGIAEQGPLGALTSDTHSGWLADEATAAKKISKTQIERYWRAKEAERLAPRVHQQGLGTHEKILREWDVSGEFGPCIGIARLKRWKRANALGLKPPIEVLAVLLKELDGEGKEKVQRAHVDDLMSSRFAEV